MTKSLEIPHGYRLVEADSITASEVMALRSFVGWDTGEEALWACCIARSLHVAGSRDEQGTLTAVAFLAGNLRHAVLCDLCVHPAHQKRGLGKTLLLARIAAADALKIPYIYTSLSPDNYLCEIYKSLGFQQTGGELFWNRSAN